MEPKKKQTRKSVPRPNSGRRAVDGAMDLVKVGVRLSKAQHEWVKANGQHALRQLIQAHIVEAGTGLSIASVNAALKRLGAEERLVRGKDYFYFTDGDSHKWPQTAIYGVARVSDMSIDRWIEEYKDLKEAAR